MINRPPAPAQHPAGVRRERGSVALEMVIVFPVFVVFVLGIVQGAMWWHSQHVVRAAASEGARAARLYGAAGEDGHEAANRFLAGVAAGEIDRSEVTVHSDGDTVTVTVTGTAPNIVPGLQPPVRASVTYPIETYRPATP